MAKHYNELSSADFELVQENLKIHDKAFETKPTTFLKDAIKRFCKNKSSIVAFFIIGILVLLSIFLPIFSNKNITYVSVDESFLAPKLFNVGTGFWDGTRKYTNIVYDEVNKVPADFYAPGVTNLKVLGDSYINTTSKYGSGGYAVLVNDTATNAYMYSYPVQMSKEGNYKVKVVMYDLPNYNEGAQAEYAIKLRVAAVDDKGNSTFNFYDLRDFSKEYGTYEFDLSEVFEQNNLDAAEASIYFDIKPVVKNPEDRNAPKKSYVMVEQVLFSADETVSNFSELETVSMIDANKALLLALDANKEKPVGYWTATATKNIYNVKVTICEFTYDTYAEPYCLQEYVYAPSDLNDLRKKGYCDYEDNDIAGTFVVLDEDRCPVSEIIDVRYTSKKPYKAIEVKCIVKKHLTYTHGGKEATYTRVPKFLFGTDNQGHDVLKKSLAGLRTSLLLGVCTAAFCFAFGLVWGSISGYFGGTVDLLMERFCEILGGVPSTIVLTIAILKFGNNFVTFFLALCLTGWMGVAGRTRTQFYRYKGREYVLASRTLGSSDLRLIFKHILPNSMGTIITGSVLMITSVIYSEATLAYLNLGLQGTQSFGVMMSDNQQYLNSYSYLVLEPAIIISLLMISFNLFGNGLRDAFNPSLKGSE